jgi:hypothetical protein
MKKLTILLFLAPVLAISAYTAFASEHDIVFICSKGMGYSRGMVEKAFKAQLDEPHLVDNAKLKNTMLEVIGVDAARYKRAWDRNFFRRALNPPVTRDSDAAVIDYVASHGEAIGYVSSVPQNANVEVCGK